MASAIPILLSYGLCRPYSTSSMWSSAYQGNLSNWCALTTENRKRDNWFRSLGLDTRVFVCRIPNVFLFCMPSPVSSLTASRSGNTDAGQEHSLCIQFGSVNMGDVISHEELVVVVQANYRKVQRSFVTFVGRLRLTKRSLARRWMI